MAGETYTAPGAIAAGNTGRASWAQDVHESVVIAGKPRFYDLGGDELAGHTNTSYGRLTGAREVELCAEDLRGLTVTLRVWVRVSVGSPGTVRVRLRNTDDSSNVAEMVAAVSDATLTLYEVACTIPTGTTPKKFRLEIIAGSASYPAYAFGQLKVKL